MAVQTSTATFNEALWAAFSEPTRRQLIDILLGKGQATASSLAEVMPISRQAVSKHMTVLLDAGLITSEKKGKEMRYSVRSEGLREAASEMSLAAQNWDKRLLLIKQLAEKEAKRR